MKKKSIAIVTVVCMLMSTSASFVWAGSGESAVGSSIKQMKSAEEDQSGKVENGWDDIKTHYYKDGVAQTGWQTIEGKDYYFDSDGKLVKNKKVGSYYVDKSGVKVYKKWVKISGKYYYYGSKGKRVKNSLKKRIAIKL